MSVRDQFDHAPQVFECQALALALLREFVAELVEVDLRKVDLEPFCLIAAWPLGLNSFVDDAVQLLKKAGDVHIRVSDFPTDDVLDELNAETPFDLLGLFQGVGLAHDEAVPRTGRMPNMIWLYRRPILDYWAEHEETLGGIVTHVLIHEIGHHFGLSDDDMEAIEAAAGD